MKIPLMYILIIASILFAGCVTESSVYLTQRNVTLEHQSCNTDSDCVMYPGSCHISTCINSDYTDYFGSAKSKFEACTADSRRSDLRNNSQCLCHKNVCANSNTHPFYQIKEFMTEIPKVLIVNPFRNNNDEIAYFGLKNNNSLNTKYTLNIVPISDKNDDVIYHTFESNDLSASVQANGIFVGEIKVNYILGLSTSEKYKGYNLELFDETGDKIAAETMSFKIKNRSTNTNIVRYHGVIVDEFLNEPVRNMKIGGVWEPINLSINQDGTFSFSIFRDFQGELRFDSGCHLIQPLRFTYDAQTSTQKYIKTWFNSYDKITEVPINSDVVDLGYITLWPKAKLDLQSEVGTKYMSAPVDPIIFLNARVPFFIDNTYLPVETPLYVRISPDGNSLDLMNNVNVVRSDSFTVPAEYACDYVTLEINETDSKWSVN